MKKFRYKFPTALTVVTIIASVAIFGLSLFNILRLCEVGSLETFNPALDILSVVLCLLIFALLVSLLIFSAFKVDCSFSANGRINHCKKSSGDLNKLDAAKINSRCKAR